MEEQSSTKNSPMHFMSTNFGGDCSNDVSNVSGDDPNQHILMAAGNWKGKGNQNDPLNVTCWMEPIEPSQSCVKLLAESISFPQTDPEYKLDTHPSTIRGKSSVYGVSEMQRDMSCNNQGISHRYKRIGSSIDMDALKVKFPRQHNKELNNKFLSTQHQVHAENAYIHNCNNTSQVVPRAIVAASGSLSRPCPATSKSRAAMTDRQRRMRIDERVKALRELLPHSEEDNQAAILDDVIDYIKHLQLQIKDLSKTRLHGESTKEPIVFLEGYGHYLCQQHMCTEPLEEMMGKLLEVNPLAAVQLLESKGLFLASMDLINELI